MTSPNKSEFCLVAGEQDDQYGSRCCVEICNVFMVQDDCFSLKLVPYDNAQHQTHSTSSSVGCCTFLGSVVMTSAGFFLDEVLDYNQDNDEYDDAQDGKSNLSFS